MSVSIEIKSPLASMILAERLSRRAEAVLFAADPLKAELDFHDHVRDHATAIYQRAFDSVLDERAREAHVVVKKKKDFAFAFWLRGLDADMAAALAAAGRSAYAYTERALASKDWGAPAERAEHFAEGRAADLKNVPKEVSKRLVDSIQRAVKAGESPLALARRIDEAVRQAKEADGARMAETEAQVAYGAVQDAALKAVGMTHKRWISRRDEVVRPTHQQCDKLGAIPIGKVFPNGLRYPGDVNGGPEEVCGCRCWLVGEKR